MTSQTFTLWDSVGVVRVTKKEKHDQKPFQGRSKEQVRRRRARLKSVQSYQSAGERNCE